MNVEEKEKGWKKILLIAESIEKTSPEIYGESGKREVFLEG